MHQNSPAVKIQQALAIMAASELAKCCRLMAVVDGKWT